MGGFTIELSGKTQVYVEPTFAASNNTEVAQIFPSVPIFTTGIEALIVTSEEADAEQPCGLVTTTLYDPEVKTVIAWVVSLVLHKNEEPKLPAFNVTEELQAFVTGEIATTGIGLMFTSIVSFTVPQPFVTDAT